MKRKYCAYCGLRILNLAIPFEDEEGRVFRYHKRCSGPAETQREKERAAETVSDSEPPFPERGV